MIKWPVLSSSCACVRPERVYGTTDAGVCWPAHSCGAVHLPTQVCAVAHRAALSPSRACALRSEMTAARVLRALLDLACERDAPPVATAPAAASAASTVVADDGDAAAAPPAPGAEGGDAGTLEGTAPTPDVATFTKTNTSAGECDAGSLCLLRAVEAHYLRMPEQVCSCALFVSGHC